MAVNLLCKQCNLDTFCVLRQSFCGNFKLSAEFYFRKFRLLGCMLPSPDDYGIFLCHKKTSTAFLRCGARQKNYLQLKTFNRLKSIKKVKASTKPIGITPTFKVCRKKPTSYFVNISFAWGLPQIKMSFYGSW